MAELVSAQSTGRHKLCHYLFSVGSATTVALSLALPDLCRKIIVSSASFSPDGNRPENMGAMEVMSADMLAGTPMEADYLAKSPNPDGLQTLLDKLAAMAGSEQG